MLETEQKSDSALSGSELYCSGVVGHTDSDDAGTHTRSFHRLKPDSPSTSAHAASGLPSESLITQNILDQLQVIGIRLDNLKKANVKKTSDKTKVKSTGAGTLCKGTGKCKQSTQSKLVILSHVITMRQRFANA